MPSTPGPGSPPANDAPVADETTITKLRVRGKLPAALTGQYLQIGPNRIHSQSPADWAGGEGMVHAVGLDSGRAISYRNRWITTDAAAQKLGIEPAPGPRAAGEGVVAAGLIAFCGSILALGDGTLAYKLSARLDTIRRVDLAGARRRLAAHANVDPETGELHLLTASQPSQLHVAVSRGALTRAIRSIEDAPSRIRQIELTRDDIVLITDGFVGVAAKAGISAKATWFEIDTEGREVAGAYTQGETVIVHAIGPSLVRWTLDRRAGIADSQVLDATPHTAATGNRQQPGAARRFLWTVGVRAAHRHDLVTAARRTHDFGDTRTPGQFVFVADPDRDSTEDGGWLVGFVHDKAGNQAEFVVLDAAAVERPAVATVHIPRRVPHGARAAWIPATQAAAPLAT